MVREDIFKLTFVTSYTAFLSPRVKRPKNEPTPALGSTQPHLQWVLAKASGALRWPLTSI